MPSFQFYASARVGVLRHTPLVLRRRLWFWREYHRWLSLRRPATFAEKMNWRISYDRRPLLEGTCDKLAAKDFARERSDGLALRVPVTYWSGTDVGELASLELPEKWVLKPNHRSGLVILGSGTPDVASLRHETRGWLDEWQWSVLGEWAYGGARRAIVAEERIGSGAVPPATYKVFVFDGVPRLIQVIEGRPESQTQRYYTDGWVAQPYESRSPVGPVRPRPPELSSLLELAGRLGQGFDFIRVDLYIVDGEIWFGELTPYSHGGGRPSGSPGIDAEIGALWRLPSL